MTTVHKSKPFCDKNILEHPRSTAGIYLNPSGNTLEIHLKHPQNTQNTLNTSTKHQPKHRYVLPLLKLLSIISKPTFQEQFSSFIIVYDSIFFLKRT